MNEWKRKKEREGEKRKEGRKTGRTWFGKYYPQQKAGLEKSSCSQVPKSWSKALFPQLISIMLAAVQKNSEISVSYYDMNLFFNHIKLDCYSGLQANKSSDISQVSTSKAAQGVGHAATWPRWWEPTYHMESMLAGVGSAGCHFHPYSSHLVPPICEEVVPGWAAFSKQQL